MSRACFIKSSLKAGTLLPLASSAAPLFSLATKSTAQNPRDTELIKKIIAANDRRVAMVLQSDHSVVARTLGHYIGFLSAAYATPDSTYFHKSDLIKPMQDLLSTLSQHQASDGTLNLGNLESPPDTAFLLESVTAAAFILKKDNSAELSSLNNGLKSFIQKAGEGLIIGGVHTPNHRWVISSVLARVNELYPDKRYLARISDWEGEGIFMDKDGHYPERSQNYANVENNSMITMGRLLNRSDLFEFARRNLEMTYYYMEPNGDLVVNDSRRQDQWTSKHISAFYLHYRYLAIGLKNGMFAAITKLIESMPQFESEVIGNLAFDFMENPTLQEQLPTPADPSTNFEKLFTTSSLLRIRRQDTTSTLFGGCDLPIFIASGRSNSPNFFAYRKGKAILKYMRLSTAFFSTGYFYSEGISKQGSSFVLHSKLSVPYYQPLPQDKRKKDGDYALTPSIDDRFWNKMDFPHRPVSNLKTLDTKITLTETNGSNQLDFEINGPAGVQVTIELCFNEGGKLSGVTTGDSDNNFLTTGEGLYEFGGDSIHFGPGTGNVRPIRDLEGERYSTHFGSLRTPGMHVYVTGLTPFKHSLKFG